MTTNFTDNGIMVSEGEVIAQNVSVQVHYNGQENFLSLSYIDENGVLNKTMKSVHDYSLMVDPKTITIDSVLPKNENWYLFWNNENTPAVFGL